MEVSLLLSYSFPNLLGIFIEFRAGFIIDLWCLELQIEKKQNQIFTGGIVENLTSNFYPTSLSQTDYLQPARLLC